MSSKIRASKRQKIYLNNYQKNYQKINHKQSPNDLAKKTKIIKNYSKLSETSEIIKNYRKLSSIAQYYPKLTKITLNKQKEKAVNPGGLFN